MENQAQPNQVPPSVPPISNQPISSSPSGPISYSTSNASHFPLFSKKVLFLVLGGIILAAIPFTILTLVRTTKEEAPKQPDSTNVVEPINQPTPNIALITPVKPLASSSSELKSYTSTRGKFRIKYKSDYQLLENQKTVNGTMIFASNTIEISASQSPVFSTQITYKNAGSNIVTSDYIKTNGYCVSNFPEKQKFYSIGKKNALFFEDVSCGTSNNLSAIIAYNDPFIYDIIIESKDPYKQIQPSIDSLLSNFQFLDATGAGVLAAVAPTEEELKNWNDYKDNKYTFQFKYPSDWLTVIKDFPEDGTHQINIAKKETPTTFSLSFTIKQNWDNMGLVQFEKKNLEVGGVKAYRYDPPSKVEKRMDQYISNTYFEDQGRSFIFACVHNWNEDYMRTCDQILSTVKLKD